MHAGLVIEHQEIAILRQNCCNLLATRNGPDAEKQDVMPTMRVISMDLQAVTDRNFKSRKMLRRVAMVDRMVVRRNKPARDETIFRLSRTHGETADH